MTSETQRLRKPPPAAAGGKVYPISGRYDVDGVPYVRVARTGPADHDGVPYVRLARPVVTGFLFTVGVGLGWLVVLGATNVAVAVWDLL